MQQNIGGLFQWLQSEACTPFYDHLTPENRADIVEQCMSNTDFMEAASAFVEDIAVIRQKLETKVGQLCKKMAESQGGSAASLRNALVSNTGETFLREKESRRSFAEAQQKNLVEESRSENVILSHIPPISKCTKEEFVVEGDQERLSFEIETEIEDKGTHIGSGYYLKREGHLIKMTSPEWTIYY